MESQIKCNATTGENIPNTSAKPANGRVPAKFKLLDLHRLTFRLDEQGPEIDVETATPEQFNAFASEVADVEEVNTEVWPLEQRRDFVNELWTFCEAEGFDFPLTEAPDEAASEAEGA